LAEGEGTMRKQSAPPKYEDFGLTEDKYFNGWLLRERLAWLSSDRATNLFMWACIFLVGTYSTVRTYRASGFLEEDSSVWDILFHYAVWSVGAGLIGGFVSWIGVMIVGYLLIAIVTKSHPIFRRMELYKSAIDEYRIYLNLKANYEGKKDEIVRKHQEEKEEQQQIKEDYEKLQTEWERLAYESIPEEHRRVDGQLLRVGGSHILKLIDWRQFEVVMAHILTDLGWDAETTSHGADGGVDVIGYKGDDKLFVQAKHFSTRGRVGRPALQKIVGTSIIEKCNYAILASSTDFSAPTLEYYEQFESSDIYLELWNGEKIAGYIDRLSMESYLELVTPMKESLFRKVALYNASRKR